MQNQNSPGTYVMAPGNSPYDPPKFFKQELGNYDKAMLAAPTLEERQEDFDFPLISGADNKEIRAHQQSVGEAFWNGIRSRAVSIPVKILQGGAIALSAPYAIANGSIDKLYDNALVNMFASWDEGLREILPVYGTKEKYYSDSILKNIGSAKFWAEDFMDGVAFAVSAWAGGSGAISAMKGLGKGFQLTKALTGSKAFKALASLSSEAAIKNGIEVGAATAYNTITEAGFEANGLKKDLQDELAKKRYNKSFEELEDTDKKTISEEVAPYAKNTFWANSAILAVPNIWQSKVFFGKNAGSGSQSLFKSLLKGEHSPEDLKKAVNLGRKAGIEAGKGVLAEGVWEENIQTAITNYEKRRMEHDVMNIGEDPEARIPGYAQEWLNNFTTTEGKKSMILGALIGGPMGAVSGIKEARQKRLESGEAVSKYENLLKNIDGVDERLFENIKTVYKQFDEEVEEEIKDEAGNVTKQKKTVKTFINPETQKREEDIDNIVKLMQSQAQSHKDFTELISAAAKNDNVHLNVVKEEVIARRVYDIITDPAFESIEEGIEYLKSRPDVDFSQLRGLENEFKEESERIKKRMEDYGDYLGKMRRTMADIKDFEKDSHWNNFKRKVEKALFLNKAVQDGLIKSVEEVLENPKTQNKKKLSFVDLIKYAFESPKAKVARIDKELEEEWAEEEKLQNYKDQETIDYLRSFKSLEETINNKTERDKLFELYKKEQTHLDELYKEAEKLKTKKDKTQEEYDELDELLYEIEEEELLRGESRTSGESNESFRQKLASNRMFGVTEDEKDRLKPFGMLNEFQEVTGKAYVARKKLNRKWFGENGRMSYNDPEALLNALAQLSESSMGPGEYLQEDYFVPIADKKDMSPEETEELERQEQAKENSIIEDLKKLFKTEDLDFVTAEEAEAKYFEFKNLKSQFEQEYEYYGVLKEEAMKNENYIASSPEDVVPYLKSKIARNRTIKRIKSVQQSLKENENYSDVQAVTSVIREVARLQKLFKREKRKELLENPHFKGFLEELEDAMKVLNEILPKVQFNANNSRAKQLKAFDNDCQFRFESLGLNTTESTEGKIKEKGTIPGLFDIITSVAEVVKQLTLAITNKEHKFHKKYYEEIIKILKGSEEKSNEIKTLLSKRIAELKTKVGVYYSGLTKVEIQIPSYRVYGETAADNPVVGLTALVRYHKSGRKNDASKNNPIDNFYRSKDLYQFKKDMDAGIPSGYAFETSELKGLVDIFYELQMAYDLLNDLNSQYDQIEESEKEQKLLEEESLRVEELRKKGDKKVFELVPTLQQMLSIRSIVKWFRRPSNFDEHFDGWMFLKGIAGSGKTTMVYKWALKILGLKENEVFATAHIPEATKLINSVLPSSNKSEKLSKSLTVSDISNEVKLLVIDEVGTLSKEEVANISSIVVEINKSRAKNNKLRVLIMGDPNQINKGIAGSPVIENWVLDITGKNSSEATKILSKSHKIESAIPLTVPYRSKIGIINSVAERFMDNFNQVTDVELLSNGLIGEESLGMHSGTVQDMVKQINATKGNGKRKVLACINPDSVPEELKSTGIEIKQFEELQSLSFDEVYVYIDPNHFKLDKNIDYKTYNDAMYTTISRSTGYVFIVDFNNTFHWIKDATVSVDNDQFEKDMEHNLEDYSSNIEFELEGIEKKEKEKKKGAKKNEDDKKEQDKTPSEPKEAGIEQALNVDLQESFVENFDSGSEQMSDEEEEFPEKPLDKSTEDNSITTEEAKPVKLTTKQIELKHPSYEPFNPINKTLGRVPKVGDKVFGIVVNDNDSEKEDKRVLLVVTQIEEERYAILGEMNSEEATKTSVDGEMLSVRFYKATPPDIAKIDRDSQTVRIPNLDEESHVFKGAIAKGTQGLGYLYNKEMKIGPGAIASAVGKLTRLFKGKPFKEVKYSVAIMKGQGMLDNQFGKGHLTIKNPDGKGNIWKGVPYAFVTAISNKGKKVVQYIRLDRRNLKKDEFVLSFDDKGNLVKSPLMEPLIKFVEAIEVLEGIIGDKYGNPSFLRNLQEFKNLFYVDPDSKEIKRGKEFTYEMYLEHIKTANTKAVKDMQKKYEILTPETFEKIKTSSAIDDVIKGYYGYNVRKKEISKKDFEERYKDKGFKTDPNDKFVYIDEHGGQAHVFVPYQNNPEKGNIRHLEYLNGQVKYDDSKKFESFESEDYLLGGTGKAQLSLDLIAKANADVKEHKLRMRAPKKKGTRILKNKTGAVLTTKAPSLLEEHLFSPAYRGALKEFKWDNVKKGSKSPEARWYEYTTGNSFDPEQPWFVYLEQEEQWLIDNGYTTREEIDKLKSRFKYQKVSLEDLKEITTFEPDGSHKYLKSQLDMEVINKLGSEPEKNKEILDSLIGTGLSEVVPTRVILDIETKEIEESNPTPTEETPNTEEDLEDDFEDSLFNKINAANNDKSLHTLDKKKTLGQSIAQTQKNSTSEERPEIRKNITNSEIICN